MPRLSEQEIAARIKLGENFVKRFARNDRDASAKFRDSSNLPGYIPLDDASNQNEGGDVPLDTAVGQSNLLATNIITKVASIAIGNPDWHVKVHESTPQSQVPENAANIAREFLRAKWKLYNWVRVSQKALYKRYVAGMGCLAYRWDKETRATFEHVQSWDLAVDPNVRDWRKVDWGARKIKMSIRKARERYPRAEFTKAGDGTAAADAEKVEIWLYYDQENECAVYDGKIIESGDNLYKAVPFLFFEGDIDPGTSMWPLSDFILAEGLQIELSDLNLTISNSAKHGGPMNLVDIKRLGAAGKEALENGMEQGYIPVDDLVTPPVHRIEGEPLSQTLIEAKREAQQSLDAITGVTQFQRGVVNQGVKFATEAALIGNQSGARGIQARIEYELFLNRMAETVILLETEFGGPDEENPEQHTDEQLILWECLSAVTEVTVLESSTTYKDPSFELQQGMQLLNLAGQLFPLFAQTGLPTPNLQQYMDDILRAAGKYDLERYWMEPAPQASGPPPPEVKISLSGQLSPDEIAQAFGVATGGQQDQPAMASGGDGHLPPGNVARNGLAH